MQKPDTEFVIATTSRSQHFVIINNNSKVDILDVSAVPD